VADRLRALWDFDDLDASEERFRAALRHETSDRGRADVLTQLARVEGLRERFAEGDRLLDEAAALSATPVVDLERGRLRRSAGDPQAALPLFEAAYASALEAGEDFLAADAAHMAALVSPDPREWTERGVELAQRSEQAAYWLGPLLNNLGWAQYEAGEYGDALASFSQALAARERDPDRPYEIEIARYAVAKTLLALGRPAEAAELLQRAVAWAASAGVRDRWFEEALAEARAGRDEPAMP
jgi:tetratricopeptide (TPR) repeat protein